MIKLNRRQTSAVVVALVCAVCALSYFLLSVRYQSEISIRPHKKSDSNSVTSAIRVQIVAYQDKDGYEKALTQDTKRQRVIGVDKAVDWTQDKVVKVNFTLSLSENVKQVRIEKDQAIGKIKIMTESNPCKTIQVMQEYVAYIPIGRNIEVDQNALKERKETEDKCPIS